MTARSFRPALFAGIAACALLATGAAQALPTGGTVVANTGGGATISAAGSTMTVNQAADRAIIDWSTFQIAPGETVTFNQPANTSITFNRIPGAISSTINGNLNANGGVFLFSNGGLFFGPSANVNVGSIVASSVMLSPSDYSTVLTTNRLIVRPPPSLNPNNPFPTVSVNLTAVIHANAGEAVIIGPTIDMGGAITSSKSTTFIPSEGAQIDYGLTAGGLEERPLNTVILWVDGRGRISMNSSGTVLSAGGFIVNTPSPVLELGYTNVINLNGHVNAQGVVAGANDSIELFASGPVAPGFNGNVNESPGSGPIHIDASAGVMVAGHDFRFSVEDITFGGLLVSGLFNGQAYGDIIFNAPVSVVGNVGFSNADNLRFGNSGVGNVTFNSNAASGASFGFDSNGTVTFAPGVHITATTHLGWGPLNSTDGVAATVIGANAVLQAGTTLSWAGGTGPTTIGSGAQLISTGSTVTGFGTTMVMGDNSLIRGQKGVGFSFTDAVWLKPGSQIVSNNNLRSLNTGWPLSVFINGPGGVYLQAGALRLEGSIWSYGVNGTGLGDIDIEANNATTQMILGGPDPGAPTNNGVFLLSNPEFQRLHGGLQFGVSPFTRNQGLAITVRDLSIDAAQIPVIAIYDFGANNVTVSGVVQSVGSGRPDFRIGYFELYDNPSGNDASVAQIPDNVFILGALGTLDQPLGHVGIIAQHDILMGSSNFITTAHQNSSFDPLAPNTLIAPSPGQIFVAADTLQLAANGRIFGQNSSTAPTYSGIVINAPTSQAPLIFGPDWAALQAGAGFTFNFPANTPQYPSYGAGPVRVNLYGAFHSGVSLIGGQQVAQNQFLIAGVTTTADSRINDCAFGQTCSSGGGTGGGTGGGGAGNTPDSQDSHFYDPTGEDSFGAGQDFAEALGDEPAMAANDQSNAESHPNPDAEDGDAFSEMDMIEAELLASFITVPAGDPEEDKERLVQSVTGAGNGDLWIIPTPTSTAGGQ